MPIPTKWKLVAGSAAAIVGVSTAAAALTGSEPEELDLDDVVAVTEVTTVPTLEFSVAPSDIAAADADDSLSSPFDGDDDSPDDSVDTDGDEADDDDEEDESDDDESNDDEEDESDDDESDDDEEDEADDK